MDVDGEAEVLYNGLMEIQKRVGAGVGIIVLDDGKVLLGQRLAKAGDGGTWTMPGGKLDWGETFEKTGIREVKEETDIDVHEIEVFCVQNDMVEHGHFVTIGLIAKKWTGTPKTMEPDKIINWKWFDLDNVPTNLYPPSAKCIENLKSGKFYSE